MIEPQIGCLVSPKGYKILTLVGELYRCNNTTTTPEALDRALKDTKNIFLKNQYPLKGVVGVECWNCWGK